MFNGVTMTAATARVVRAFLEDPAADRYGFDLMRATGLASGSLYPILARLDRAGWIVGHREDIDPAQAGRSPRRYYTMPAHSAERARIALAEMSALFAPPPRPVHGLRWVGGQA